MDVIEAQPGDVLLFRTPRPGYHADPITAIIAKVTHSPYTHSAIAVGQGSYRHATVDARGDVREFKDTDLPAVAVKRCVDLYRLPGATFDLVKMKAAVARATKLAAPDQPDPTLFSVGALAGLALLRQVAPDPDEAVLDGLRDRLRRALLRGLEDGWHRIFCSEFVWRISAESGCEPPLPPNPFIPDDALPIEPLGIEGWVKDWIHDLFVKILEGLHLDELHWSTVTAVVDDVWEAFKRDDPGPLRTDRGNYFTPRDFTGSVYERIASFDSAAGRWGALEPLPT